MARAVQVELFRTHGGKRAGAGRPRGPGRKRNWVRRRPVHAARLPVHVTLRVVDGVGRLRRRSAYKAVRRALLTSFVRQDFRIAHLSIQRNHIHLICEADTAQALGRGLKGFEVSAARRLNAAVARDRNWARPRRGQVFPERYHAEVLHSPRQVRNCLAYVLNNWRRHDEDRAGVAQRRALIDPYASGIFFDGWADRRHGDGRHLMLVPPEDYDPLPVLYPQTWLLREGWRRHGLIDPRETPGERQAPVAGA